MPFVLKQENAINGNLSIYTVGIGTFLVFYLPE